MKLTKKGGEYRVTKDLLTNKRLSERLSKNYKVLYHEYRIPVRDEETMAVTKNISPEGILFESERDISPGTLLRLKLRMPGWERCKGNFLKNNWTSVGEPFVALGTVVRAVEHNDKAGYYDIGVKFVNLYEDDKIALQRYLITNN